MKKYIVCILLICPAFPLCAQSSNPYVSVYVLPVTGNGSTPEDNALFFKQLGTEVTYQRYRLAKTLKDADFSLVGTLYPHPDNSEEPSGVRQYVFHLTLLDNKANQTRAEGELVYTAAEDLNNLFPVLVYTLLHTIPEDMGKNDWRNKWLYVGGNAFWTPRVYTADSALTHIPNLGGGVFAEYHFLDYLSVGAGFEIASDMIKIFPSDSQIYSNILLEIPVFVKYVIKPGEFFLLEPYAGIHFNIPFKKTTEPPVISWMVGFQYGIKLGPGVLYIDPRFSMDIGKSALNADPSSGVKELSFQRYIIHLGIGYKLGFFTKK